MASVLDFHDCIYILARKQRTSPYTSWRSQPKFIKLCRYVSVMYVHTPSKFGCKRVRFDRVMLDVLLTLLEPPCFAYFSRPCKSKNTAKMRLLFSLYGSICPRNFVPICSQMPAVKIPHCSFPHICLFWDEAQADISVLSARNDVVPWQVSEHYVISSP